MGIDNLTDIVKTYAPAARGTMALKVLKNHRVAIDAGKLYADVAVIRREQVDSQTTKRIAIDYQAIMKELIIKTLKFISELVKAGVGPIFVFDGPSRSEKYRVMDERAAKNKTDEDRIQFLYQLHDQNPDGFGDIQVNELKAVLRGYNKMPHSLMRTVRTILQGLGIPVLQARDDAEQLCASLCMEKKVAAVWSVDGDTLVFGACLMVRGFVKGSKTTVEYTRLDIILGQLNFTFGQFVDMCILNGCDFNKKIRGYGPKKVFETIRDHHTIEQHLAHQVAIGKPLDTTTLRYEICRAAFSFQSSSRLSIDLVEPPTVEERPVGAVAIERMLFDFNRAAGIRAQNYLDLVNATAECWPILDVIYRSYNFPIVEEWVLHLVNPSDPGAPTVAGSLELVIEQVLELVLD